MIKLVSLTLRNFKQYRTAHINFPEKGKILIKGKNEAGKSTIFEAIGFALFGKPVYVGTISNLIKFNTEKAEIELIVKTEDKILNISRTLKKSPQGSTSQEATLRIKQNNNPTPIIVTNPSSVNPRIIKEIGIDQDIFINTCFIGQKRLETLENLGAKERQQLISKLFNLDYFVNLIEKAKDTRKEFISQKENYELIRKAAEAKKELPEIKERINEIENRIKEIEKIELSQNIVKKDELLNNLEEEIKKLEEEFDKVKKDVELLEKCKEEEKIISEIKSIEEKIKVLERQKSENLQRIKNLEERIKEEGEIREKIRFLEEVRKIKSQIDETTKTINEEKLKISKLEEIIPNLSEKVEKYKETIKEIEKEKTLLDEINKVENEIQKLEGRKRNLEKRKERLEKILNNFSNTKEILDPYKKALEYKEKEIQIFSLQKDFSKAKNRLILTSTLTILSFVLSFALNYFFLIPSLVFLIFSFLTYRNYSQTNKDLTKQLSILEFIKKDIPDHLRDKNQKELEQELQNLEKELEAKKIKTEKIIESLKTKASSIDTLTLIEERTKLKREIDNINSLKTEAERLISELASKLSCNKDIKSIEEKLLKAQEILEKKKQEIKEKETEMENLKKSDPLPDKELLVLSSEKGSLENRLKNIDDYKKELADKEKRKIELEEDIKRAQDEIEKLSKKLPSLSDDYINKLKDTIKDLEERKVKEKYDNISSQLNNKRGQREAVEKEYTKLIEEFKNRFEEENWKDYASISIDSKEKEMLLSQKEELIKTLGEKEAILEEYESKTGQKRDDLIPEKVEEDYKEIERKIQKMDYAIKIAESTRESILKSILPRTMAFMQRILPILTSDRYHYAEIDEDYKLRVYTSDTKDPLGKERFSGGTQDQISLALRLAFAMATLPQDKGVQPKFIFLDEPLGSFDEDRAKGLLYLITQGEVSEFFDQIFVVTHVPIDEDLFDEVYYIDNGQITKIDNDNPNLNLEF